jgi:tetratricopeptide (TPR) repeat protein
MQPDAEAYFLMLETIRQYALERLASSGEAPTIERAHAGYYLALAERAEPELGGSEQVHWLGRLRAEHHNLQAALGWAREAGEVELGLRLAGALCPYWNMGGYFGEGCSWIEELLTLAESGADSTGAGVIAGSAVTASTRAKVLCGAAFLLTNQGDPQRVDAYLAESLALRRQLGDRAGIAEVLVVFGAELSHCGDAVRATELLEEGLALYRELGDYRGIAEALEHLAYVARDRGDDVRAITMYEQTLALRRKVGDLRGVGISLFYLGAMAAGYQQDYPRAVALYEEALTISRRIGEQQLIAPALNNLAVIADKMGDPARAMALYDECLVQFREQGRLTGVASVLLNMGHIVCAQGDTKHAKELLQESLRLAWQTRRPRTIAYVLETLAEVASAERCASAAASLYGAAAALRESASVAIQPDDSADYDRAVAEVRTALGEDAFAAAWAAGAAMELEEVIACAIEEASQG